MKTATFTVLILGGTGDGARLAAALAYVPRVAAVSSLAGRVAAPVLPAGRTRVGGFGGIDGFVDYLRAQSIDAVIDATHPYAATISGHAVLACERASVPLFALLRPPWTIVPGDDWHDAADVSSAAKIAAGLGRRVFVTVGRQELAPFAVHAMPWYLIRAIDPPQDPLPPHHELLLARGPFCLEDELRLMRGRGIDVVVSKNSGGTATYAKIEAARLLGLPVVMVRRPSRPAVPAVGTIEAAIRWVEERLR